MAMSASETSVPVLPRVRVGVSPARRWSALAIACIGLPVLTSVLLNFPSLSLASVLLIYVFAVVGIATLGGTLAAAVAAVLSFLLANWFFTIPLHTFRVANRDSIIDLVVFLVVAVTVSLAVDLSARRSIAAQRSQIEASILSAVSSLPVAQATEDVLATVQQLFHMDAVALIDLADNRREVARVGPATSAEIAIQTPAGEDLELVAFGQPIFAEDRQLLSSLAHAAGRAEVTKRLSDEADRAALLTQIDLTRAALLAAVGHDLRTPLTRIKAAVSGLRQPDVVLSDQERTELLATIEDGSDTLTHLISNLLDISRLEAGALSVDLQPVSVDEVVASCLIAGGFDDVLNQVPDSIDLVIADPGLLERVIANLVDNAHRYSPQGVPPRITASSLSPENVRICVVDEGPGIPNDQLDEVFTAFTQIGDRIPHEGVGLGLAIARGFVLAMGGTLEASATPGGGLTMTITLSCVKGARR